ncbi:MAG: hypothetical protein K6F34_11005 [Lachnospiraceae bacterium]|nr:hypothetical protein [Lachnospiraceae bacterium]
MSNGSKEFTIKAALVKEPSDRAASANNALAAVAAKGDTVTVSVPLDELTYGEATEAEHGNHKWVWLDIDTGLRDADWLAGLTLNERDLTVSDKDKELCGNEDGHFIFCVPAESFVRNDRDYSLKLSKEGYKDSSIDIRVENTSEIRLSAYIPDAETVLKAESRAVVPSFNNSHATIECKDNVFTITTAVSELKSSGSVTNPHMGVHNWMWVEIDTGLRGDDWRGSEENGDQLEMNGNPLREDRYTPVLSGGVNGRLTIYPPVDAVAQGPRTFTFTKPGYKPATFTLKVEDTSK